MPGDHFQGPQVGRALGGNAPGDGLFQRAVDHIRHHVADRGSCVHRRRIRGTDDRSGRCRHLHRIQRPGIVRNGRRHDAVDAERRIGFRIAQRTVDRVRGHPRRAGEIHMDRVLADGNRCNQIERLLIPVYPHRIRPRPFRQLANRLGHRAAAARNDLLTQHIQIVQPEFAHHRHQPPAADVVAGDQGVDVADDLHRFAHIRAYHRQQVFVHHPRACQAQQRNEQAFVPNLPSLRCLSDPAHVDQMRGAGEQRNDPAIHERRRNDHQVVQMPGALPRIVGDVDITFLHVLHREDF